MRSHELIQCIFKKLKTEKNPEGIKHVFGRKDNQRQR